MKAALKTAEGTFTVQEVERPIIPDANFVLARLGAGIIGRNAAIFDFGRRRLKGFSAWLLWAIVHVYLLVGLESPRLPPCNDCGAT